MKYLCFIFFTFCTYFTNAQPFFPVRVNGLWGAIDSNGKIIINPAFYQGYVCGENNEYFIGTNYKTNTVTICSQLQKDSFTNLSITYLGNNLFSFHLNSYGFPTGLRGIQIDTFYKMFKQNRITADNYMGIMDAHGNVIVEPTYLAIKDFHEGHVRVTRIYIQGKCKVKSAKVGGYEYKHCKRQVKMGMIDTTGKIILPLVYDYDQIKDYNDSFILFKKNTKYGVMDKNGKIVIEPKYSYLHSCGNGYFKYSIKSEGYGLMKKDEKIVVEEIKNRSIYYAYSQKYDTLVEVYYENDTNNELERSEIWTLKGRKLYDNDTNILKFPNSTELLLVSYNNHGYGLINFEGRKITTDTFELIRGEKTLLRVSKNRHWGFMDMTGKLVSPCRYDDAEPFNHGLARVFLEGDIDDYYRMSKPNVVAGYINRYGEIVWPFMR